MRKPAGKSRNRRGVAAAEMAIVLPFMLLLFAVALDFCRVFYAAQTIQNCAYSAALYASSTASARPDVPSPAAAAQNAALAEAVSLNPPLLPGNVTTSIANGMAKVTVTYEFPLLTPFMGKSITITRTATMGVVPQGPYWGTNS